METERIKKKVNVAGYYITSWKWMNNFIHASAHQVLRISNLKEKDTAKVVKTSKKREI